MELIVVLLVVVAAAGAVAYPLMRRASKPAGAAATDALKPDELDALVERYREAVRSGTVCQACREANSPGSRYCADCGRRLPEPESG